MANNSNIEFSFIDVKSITNTDINFTCIITSGEKLAETFGGIIANTFSATLDLVEHSHNHPKDNYSFTSDADKGFKKYLINNFKTFNKNVQNIPFNFQIYFRGKYYPY